MEDPEVLLLDEPFNGIDDQNLEIVYSLINQARSLGKIVVIASHGDCGAVVVDRHIRMSEGRIVENVPVFNNLHKTIGF